MIYLLDTNVVSALEKEPSGSAARELAKVERLAGNQICLSVIAAMEIRFGLLKKGSAKLAARVEIILSALEVLSLNESAIERYAALRLDLERRGLPIGANDMLMAAHAISLNATLVTDNVREFKRIKGLHVENWLRATK